MREEHMNPWLVAFIVFDVVVTTAVGLWIIRSRGAALTGVLGVDFAGLRRFSDSAQNIATEYLRANYSGDPEQLPGVLTGLLDRLESEARAQNLPFGRDVLRGVIRQLASRPNLASASEITKAMKRVA
jgi:hypothetical protein